MYIYVFLPVEIYGDDESATDDPEELFKDRLKRYNQNITVLYM